MVDSGEHLGPPLVLDQTEARRAKKKNFVDRPLLSLSQGMDKRAPPYVNVWIQH